MGLFVCVAVAYEEMDRHDRGSTPINIRQLVRCIYTCIDDHSNVKTLSGNVILS